MLGIAKLDHPTCLAACCLLLVALINMVHPGRCARILETRDSPPKHRTLLPKVAGFSANPLPPQREVIDIDRELRIQGKIPRRGSPGIHLVDVDNQQKHQQQHHHHHQQHQHQHHQHRHQNQKLDDLVAAAANAAPPVDLPIHEVDAKAGTLSSEHVLHQDHGRSDEDDDDDNSVDSEEMSFHADYAKVRTHPPHSH